MGIVTKLQEARRQGAKASELVRMVAPYTAQTPILDLFWEAFNFIPSDILPLSRWRLNEMSDEAIDEFLEKKFAQRRVGGYLTPNNVAHFLDLTPDELHELLQTLNLSGRVISISYPSPSDPETNIDDLEFSADLLWDLQELAQPELVSPWWWWASEAAYRGANMKR